MSKKSVSGYQAACRLFEAGKDNAHVARKTGLSLKLVSEYRWRRDNYERYLWNQTAKRRRRGQIPVEDYDAQRRATKATRAASVKPLLDAGLSFTEVGAKLGVSRNVIAGIVWRGGLTGVGDR